MTHPDDPDPHARHGWHYTTAGWYHTLTHDAGAKDGVPRAVSLPAAAHAPIYRGMRVHDRGHDLQRPLAGDGGPAGGSRLHADAHPDLAQLAGRSSRTGWMDQRERPGALVAWDCRGGVGGFRGQGPLRISSELPDE